MLEKKTIDWLKLALIPEIGPLRFKKLRERFSGPAEILKASERDIRSILGSRLAQIITEGRSNLDIDKQLELIDKYKVRLVTLDDASYPKYLKNIFDPPLVLFTRGKGLTCNEAAVAIVGTRLATAYGLETAGKLSAELANKGFTVVSGGARGIDTAAHRAAVEIGARTVAVLGCAVDVVYPSENAELFQRIVENKGTLISEFPMGTKPLRQNFPRRNRIVSGLSLGVVVVQAPKRSGALITASCALEQGREVFCVPGEVNSFNMKGSHQLLKEGAKLVESVNDIIEEIENSIAAPA